MLQGFIIHKNKMTDKTHLNFRIEKLERLLIPTIKHELHNCKSHEREHYNIMLEEYTLELKERRMQLQGIETPQDFRVYLEQGLTGMYDA